MKKSFIISAAFLSSISVMSVFAATGDVQTGITTVTDIVNALTTQLAKGLGSLAMAAAMVAFFYGIVEYVWGSRQGDATKIKNGNQFMLWGVIALFVMFSVYGIVKFGQEIFFKGTDFKTITIPEINFKGSGATDKPQSSGTGGVGSGTDKPINIGLPAGLQASVKKANDESVQLCVGKAVGATCTFSTGIAATCQQADGPGSPLTCYTGD